MDLACGSGEVTSIISCIFTNVEIFGIDPYTFKNYHNNTGKVCYPLSFENLAQLNDLELLRLKCDVIICSYHYIF
jgi:ubiquinone/menaquinone biosynthesis C-methylase UbiE